MRKAFKFILLLGVVSLFADATYEGARSITGPFLSVLGASGTAVGLIVGLSELIGYGLRGLSGYLTDKTERYWLLTITGYVINLLAVPLLAFVSNWQMAALLIVLERFGKAIRVPPRDTLLSYATKHTGRGWGFGVHEALDQIGAVLGPLGIAAVLFYKKSYPLAFATLAIPAVLSLVSLGLARHYFPTPQDLEKREKKLETKGFSKIFWLYIIGVSLVALGYVDFPLIAYHFKKSEIVSEEWTPFLYALAMAVDGVAALIMGRLFDLKGLSILALFTLIGSLFAPLVFFGNFYGAVIGMILWGIGLGCQESIMRASVAELVSPEKRGSAYGILNMSFGIFWGLGSAIIGFLYDLSLTSLVLFSLAAQIAAVPIFFALKQKAV